MKRFSEMSASELDAEIKRLEESIQQSKSDGVRDVQRQKWLLARSYAVRGERFPPGMYRVEGEERRFMLRYLNGVMGWGTWEDGEEAALPIALLHKEDDE